MGAAEVRPGANKARARARRVGHFLVVFGRTQLKVHRPRTFSVPSFEKFRVIAL